MPRLVEAPTTVVKTADVQIDEFFGGASCNPCGDISFARVQAGAGWAEEWQVSKRIVARRPALCNQCSNPSNSLRMFSP